MNQSDLPTDGPAWFDWPRAAVAVEGADAASYLQSQLSQDLRPLAVGGSAWSLVLQPTGKLDAIVRVVRLADDQFIVETDAGFGDRVQARLQRFKIRVKVELRPIAWTCIAVRGHGASKIVAPDGALALATPWPGIEGLDLVGEQVDPPAELRELSVTEFERMRIRAAWPWLGADVSDSTIPGETGVVPLTVSFTKGCYPGQELVERIDSRGGNVVKRLTALGLSAPVESGDVLVQNGREVGTITSVAGEDDVVALGYIHRSADLAAPFSIGNVTARVL